MIKLLNRVHPLSRGLVCAINFMEYGGVLSNDAVYGYNATLSTANSRLNATGLQIDGAGTLGAASIDNVYNKYIAGNQNHSVSFEVIVNVATNSPMLFTTQNGDYFFIEVGASASEIYWGYANAGLFYRTYTLDKPLSSWHTITVVKTGAGDSGNLYLDGKLQTSYTGTFPSIATTNDIIQVGRYRTAVTSITLNGSIRNLRIYNRSLSGNEVMQLASNPQCMFASQNPGQYYKARNQNNFFRMFN